MFRRFSDYLATREGRVSSAIVILAGVVLGVFLCLTYVDRTPRKYGRDFGSARWIHPTGATSLESAYFRGTFYIPGVVTSGWIQLAATGSYAVYVNDVEVGSATYACVRQTGIFDLKEVLAPGKNVVAIYVVGGKYPGPPQIIVRGSYRVASSEPQEFVSDSNWKVASIADGIVASYPWSSQALNDRLWGNVIEPQTRERFSTVQPLSYDPRVIEATPSGQWIEGRTQLRNESFIRHIVVPHQRGGTWLQVASTGAYDVIVDGRLVITQPEAAGTTMIGPETPVLAAPGQMMTTAQMPKAITPNSFLAGSVIPSISSVPSLAPNPPPIPAIGTLLADAKTAATQPTIYEPVQVPVIVGPGQTEGVSSTTADENGVMNAPQSDIAQVTALQTEPNALMLRNTGATPDVAGSGDVAEMPDLYSLTSPLQAPVPQLLPPPLFLGLGGLGTTPLLLAYDLTNWVSAGRNTIEIRVRNHYGPALLLAEGYTNVDGNAVEPFRTDAAWQTGSAQRAGDANTARVVANYGDQPWGFLPQLAANPQSLPAHTLRLILQWSGSLAAGIALAWLLWFGASILFAGLKDCPVERMWSSDALLHLPLLLGLLFLWLLSFDARIRSDWCFIPLVILGAVGYLVVSKLALLSARVEDAPQTTPAATGISVARWRLACGCLVVIVAIGCAIRAAGMLTISLGHDESGMIFFSWAVLKHGLPWIPSGSFHRWLSTYEIVPYPMALSSLMFGTTVFAYRFPSLLFSTGQIAVVGWMGYRMMGWRVGLVSALIYACLPMTISWGQDGFYPSQQNFLTTLIFWLFWEAIRDPGVLHGRPITICGILLTLAYLSWEGTGFVIPVLLVAVIVYKWGEFAWMADAHLWRVFAVVGAIIVIQLSYRQIVSTPDYLTIGRNLSEMTSPRLAFIDRSVYNPYFYLISEFFVENHFALTLIILSGMLFAWRQPPLLYLYVSLLMCYIMYSNFLAAYAVRYCFFWTPLLVLSAVGTFFYLIDRVRKLTTVGSLGAGVRTASCYAAGALLILGSNPFVFKLYRLSANPEGQTYFCRLGANFKPDYRAAFLYVAEHAAPGDAVLSDGPACHVYRFYASEWPDFTMDTRLISRNTYDGGIGSPRYRDRMGLAMVRNLDDLELTGSQSGRVWVVGQLDDAPKVRAYTSARGRNMYETAAQKVVVFTGVPPTEDHNIRFERAGLAPQTDFYPRPWSSASVPLPSRTRDRALLVAPEPQSPDGATPAVDPR
jgi:hypothetical protein